MEKRDVAGTDLPRDIARDTKLGIGVATQAYTRLSTWSIIVSGWPSFTNTVLHTEGYSKLGEFRGNDCARGDSTNAYRCLEVGVDVDGARSVVE